MEAAVKYLSLNDEIAVMSAKGKAVKKSGENNSVDGSVSTSTLISDAIVCVSSDEKEGKVICEENISPVPIVSEPDKKEAKVIVDLTKDDSEKDPKSSGRGCEQSDVKEDTASTLQQRNKSDGLKSSLYDDTKQVKDVTGAGKPKPAKTTSKLSDINRKKKGKTSNKKARGVQDQEIPEKKQTSLTDHFQVRRSERKLKTLGEEEAQMALRKQILSEVEDGLEIKVIDEKGRGIFASREFTRGCFVCEYAGELINFQEAKERESEYEKSPDIGSYMYFFEFRNRKYCVDATKETNRLGRLVNHSKTNSNVHTKLFPINDIPRLILVASRDIKIGEELLYDYGDRSKKSAEHHPWLKT